MRILLLTQWFDPEPTFKGLIFAKELQRRGHDIEVLTGFPNYPGGKVYPGYRVRPWQREQMDGVPVLRVALYPSHGRSGLGRTLNYVSFAAVASSFGCALTKKPDVMYVYHPPGTIGLAAAVLATCRRVPFVYDVQDLWPDSVAASGMLRSRLALGILDRWCRLVYRKANRIVVLSPGFKTALMDRGVPEAKIDVVYNWCDEVSMRPNGASPVEVASAGEFAVVFAGTMGLAQGLDAVLDAARICACSVPRARFIFIGGGIERPRLEDRAADLGLPNVRFLPRQPIQAMGSILAAGDALLVHLKDDPLFRITIPSKIQAYLAAGKPILMGVKGSAADLVSRSGAGVLCEPGNPASIAEAVCRLAQLSSPQLAEMGRRGRAFYERELSLAAGVTQFEHVFQAALN